MRVIGFASAAHTSQQAVSPSKGCIVCGAPSHHSEPVQFATLITSAETRQSREPTFN
jgi:hypothetical protein